MKELPSFKFNLLNLLLQRMGLMKKLIFILFVFVGTAGYSKSIAPGYVAVNPFAISLDTTLKNKEKQTPNNYFEVEEIENKTPEHFKYAIKLKIEVELVKDLNLFRVLSEWIGTKYVFGGNTKKGIDCSGFTQQVMKEVYNIDLHRVVTPQYNQCRPIERKDLKLGDLLFFHTTRPGLSHVGFYLGDNKFIHASCTRGVIVDDLNTTYYKNAFRKAGRILPE